MNARSEDSRATSASRGVCGFSCSFRPSCSGVSRPVGGSIAIAGWHAASICVLNPSGAVGKMMKFAGVVPVLVRMMA